jgi:hypothetical protein
MSLNRGEREACEGSLKEIKGMLSPERGAASGA